ncbi:MAG: acetyl-CoA carboxylase carboxyltransferase subunit alpha, partial [Maritimibacter harenae]
LTAQDLKALGVIERIIGEPVGGAHRGAGQAISAVGHAIEAELKALGKKKPDELRNSRRQKYLKMGSQGLAA